MKNIPKTFYIKGHKWKVKIKKNVCMDDGSPCYGLCQPNKKLITIDSGCTPDELIKTFWHEYGHALLFELHLVGPADGGMNETHEGVLCEGFSDIMFNEWNVTPKKKRRQS